MSAHRAQPVLGQALAIAVAAVLGIPAAARTGMVCTDTVFVDGFDGAHRSVGASRAATGTAVAVVSDGSNIFTLDVSAPESLTLVGSSQGSAFGLAFVDGNFDGVLGLAADYAVAPDLLASIRLSDAAITPIGTASPHNGDWHGFKQDPISGTLYAVSGCPSASTLYTINRSTAAPHTVGVLVGVSCASSLAFDAHGNLFTIDTGLDELFAIDKSTLGTSLIGPIDFDAGVMDMDFFGATGTLYVAARNNSMGRSELREMDPQSGATTLIGVIPFDYVTGFAIENAVVCSP